MQTQIPQLSITDAQTLLAEQAVKIIDIRKAEDFAIGHIDSAINATNENYADVIAQLPKDNAILVYCYHGISSQQFVQYLQSLGFNQVYSLAGGYAAWEGSE